jgi:hypothetical protein
MKQDRVGAEMEDEEYELDFTDVLRRIWRRRGLIILLPFLAACLAIFVVSITAWRSDNPVVYYISLKSIENEQYPNGSRFSPQDLLAPAVLTELRSKFKLDSAIDLRQNIQVSYGNPITEGVTRKYQDRLSARNLAQADIDSINAAYHQELVATMRAGLRIDVDFRAIGVDEAIGVAIAKTLPLIWNQVYTQQFRVLVDTTLSQAAIPTSDEALKDTASVLVANERLRNIERGLQILTDDNRLSSLTTSDRRNAEDVREELERYRTIFFDPIFRFGFSTNDPAGRSYLAQHQLDIADLQRQVAGYDQTLEQLGKYRTASGTMPPSNSGASVSNQIQLGENALDRIISLADQSSFADYVKQTLTARQTALTEISRLQKEIDWATNSDNKGQDPAFVQAAADGLKSLTASYKDLLDRARTVLISNAGQFYIELTSPRVVGSIVNLHSLILVIGAALAGLALALLIALMAPAFEKATH